MSAGWLSTLTKTLNASKTPNIDPVKARKEMGTKAKWRCIRTSTPILRYLHVFSSQIRAALYNVIRSLISLDLVEKSDSYLPSSLFLPSLGAGICLQPLLSRTYTRALVPTPDMEEKRFCPFSFNFFHFLPTCRSFWVTLLPSRRAHSGKPAALQAMPCKFTN